MKGCDDLQKKTHRRRTDAQDALIGERSQTTVGRRQGLRIASVRTRKQA